MSFKKYLVEKLKLNEMYSPTFAQIKAEKELNKQGFKFSNWIDTD